MKNLILTIMLSLSINCFASFQNPHCEKAVLEYSERYKILEGLYEVAAQNRGISFNWKLSNDIETTERELIDLSISIERLCSSK